MASFASSTSTLYSVESFLCWFTCGKASVRPRVDRRKIRPGFTLVSHDIRAHIIGGYVSDL
jgi:hypothetical protein